MVHSEEYAATIVEVTGTAMAPRPCVMLSW